MLLWMGESQWLKRTDADRKRHLDTDEGQTLIKDAYIHTRRGIRQSEVKTTCSGREIVCTRNLVALALG